MDKEVTKFIFELGQLRRVPRAGFTLKGIYPAYTVAEHALRAAQIGYLLARMENYENPHEVVTMLVFHDMTEARIGDLHKVAQRYVSQSQEDVAAKEQTAPLGEIGKDIFTLWHAVETKETTAGILAKDADYLEAAFAAKEYVEQGYTAAQDMINNCARVVKTQTAKKLIETLQVTSSTEWWQGLKNIRY